ncbi:MAG: hypothetical protein BWX80_02451 [Candidatus Hydrogenedentes bacterium ADurb.Bin101]|nr:MAG: hypothetical protein BWX80_02451 [Candidatus Hydrogenedentes bacterium ADurb.Bin101]
MQGALTGQQRVSRSGEGHVAHHGYGCLRLASAQVNLALLVDVASDLEGGRHGEIAAGAHRDLRRRIRPGSTVRFRTAKQQGIRRECSVTAHVDSSGSFYADTQFIGDGQRCAFYKVKNTYTILEQAQLHRVNITGEWSCHSRSGFTCAAHVECSGYDEVYRAGGCV